MSRSTSSKHFSLVNQIEMSEAIFSNQGNTLAGTLWLPQARPCAAVVMLAGSGPMDRDNGGYFSPVRDHFVRSGIAVLSFDKPGIGASSGDWRKQSFHDRAADAVAAVAWLRRNPALSSVKIGVWGHSQGGGIAPLAAVHSNQIAFVVCNSGPGVPVSDQVLCDFTAQLSCSGLPEEQMEQALTFARYLIDELADPSDNYENVRKAIQAKQAEAWHPIYADLNREEWEYTKRIARYDPRPILERVTCPVLAIFGGKDPLTLVPASMKAFEASFRKTGNRKSSVVLYPEADHRIQVGSPPALAPGYLESMTQWVLQAVEPCRKVHYYFNYRSAMI